MADPVEAQDDSSNFLDVDGFPDDIILEIFEKLSFSDLYSCAQVCRRWFFLSRSVHLKEIVIDGHLKFEQLSLLIQEHFSQHLETFKLLNDSSAPITSVERYDLLELRAKCPRITKLVLRRCSLLSVSMGDMPKTIRCLSIRESKIHPCEFLKGSGDERDRPQLTCLDVAGVRNCAYLSILLKPLKSLRCLCLSDCFSINDEVILSITEILPRLKILDVERTDISNKGLRIILTHCVDVEELYVGHTRIYDDVMESLEMFTQISKLSILCIRNTCLTRYFVGLLNLLLGNRVKLLTHFDSSVNGCGTGLHFFRRFIICNHYHSHACC